MSSNNNQKTCLSETNIRQSFDERICDDLSEVILQYLSLEDKLRLECVSKQFQRTIFERQYELKIPDPSDLDENYDLTAMKSMLKKCPNIKSVDFEYCIEDDFEIVCQLLVEFNYNLNQLKCFQNTSDEMWKQFKEKFGSKILSLSLFEFKPELINDFTNLRVLESSDLFLNFSDVCRLDLKNLKQLTIDYNDKEDIHLETFVDKYKSLTHLTITVKYSDRKGVQNLLTQLLGLKDLVHFYVDTHYLVDINHRVVIGINDISVINTINEMTNKWTKLKSFGGYLKPEKDSNGVLKEFQTIRGFKQLKRFIVSIDYVMTTNELFQLLGSDFIESLTHLKIVYGLFYEVYNDVNEIYLVQSMISELKQRFPKLRVCFEEH